MPAPSEPTDLFARQLQLCGCRGVPAGQHLPGCPEARPVPMAPRCRSCGYRGKSVIERCPHCGGEQVLERILPASQEPPPGAAA